MRRAIPVVLILTFSSVFTSIASASSSVPGSPQNVQADVIGTTLNVYWQPPSGDAGNSATSYFVAFTETNPVILCSTLNDNCAFQPPSTPHTTAYVVAVNSSGDSIAAEVSLPTVPPVGEYTSPLATAGPGEIVVNWNAYYSSPGTNMSYQVVVFSADPTYSGRKCVTTALHCTFTGLITKDKYEFDLQAMDGHGGFTPDDETTSYISPLASPITELMAPVLANPIRTSAGITLRWRMPVSSALPTSYYIFYGTSKSLSQMRRLTIPAPKRAWAEYLLRGLSAERYYFVVEAQMRGRISSPSRRITTIG